MRNEVSVDQVVMIVEGIFRVMVLAPTHVQMCERSERCGCQHGHTRDGGNA